MDAEIRLWQEKLFARSIRRDRKLDRIKTLVGSAMNQQCLEISEGDGVISARLRQLGGSWKTATPTHEAAKSIQHHLNETITVLSDETLPYEDGAFDRLVIVDALKWIADDYAFLHECHRVLKNDGWVIIHETRRAPASLVAPFRKLVGFSPLKNGAARDGYSVMQLFDKLKDGYDVPETITYSNGPFECAAAIGEAVQKTFMKDPYWMLPEKVGQDALHKYRRLSAWKNLTYPIAWLLSKLEFLPGHRIMVKSRRRHWRPRLQPKLIDGRSIAEAAINTKIGTAAPF